MLLSTNLLLFERIFHHSNSFCCSPLSILSSWRYVKRHWRITNVYAIQAKGSKNEAENFLWYKELLEICRTLSHFRSDQPKLDLDGASWQWEDLTTATAFRLFLKIRITMETFHGQTTSWLQAVLWSSNLLSRGEKEMEKLPLLTSRMGIYEHPRHMPG